MKTQGVPPLRQNGTKIQIGTVDRHVTEPDPFEYRERCASQDKEQESIQAFIVWQRHNVKKKNLLLNKNNAHQRLC